MKRTLEEPWSVEGDWVNVAKPSGDKVPGTLAYDPEKGLALKLHGVIGDPISGGSRLKSYPRVLGAVLGVGPCTLLNAYTSGVTFGDAARSSMGANLAIMGAALPRNRDVRFSRSWVSLGNLEEWLGWRPIKHDFKTMALTFEPPPALLVELPRDGTRIAITPSVHNESDSWQRNALVHTARVEVATKGGMRRELTWHLNLLGTLRDLVTLLSGSPSWFRSIEVARGRVDDKAFVVGARTAKPQRRIHRPQMTLPWEHVEVPFDELIAKWFDHRAEFEPAHHLLMSAYYARMPHPEFAFLTLAQALEAYGKTRLRRTCPPGKKLEFAEAMNEVVGCLGPDLRRRLFHARTGFIDNIRYTRNYFTHYNPSMAAKAYRGVDLYRAAARLRLILTLAFMKDIGIPERVLREHALKSWQVEFELKWRGERTIKERRA